MAINYAVEHTIAASTVSRVPLLLRPFLAPCLPPVKKLHQTLDQAERLLRPILKVRRQSAEGLDSEEFDDMLQWLIISQMKSGRQQDTEIVGLQLTLSFTSIHTTASTATNA